jgi:LuxR family maltose regulon positive regulatory protein
MDKKQTLINRLKELVANEKIEELEDLLCSNIESIFNNPDVSNIYQELKVAEVDKFNCTLSKLTIAWLAFLCGDNSKLFSIYNFITEKDLTNEKESSLYYALKALSSSMLREQNAIKYAKISIDILPEDDISLYMANARLTYGQLLSGSDQYRSAASMFERSYTIFSSLKLDFLAMVALVNELLNRVRIGQYKRVIKKAKQILLINSSVSADKVDFWRVINLPLGISYYDLGQINLAIKHLKIAKKGLEDIALLHMNGLTEMYLFKSYLLVDQKEKAKEILDELDRKFGQLNYEYMDQMLSMFRIYLSKFEEISIEEDIERFKLKEVSKSMNAHSFVPDVLSWLTLEKKINLVDYEKIEQLIDKFKYIGYLSKLQKSYLQVSQLLLQKNESNKSDIFLEKAIDLYERHGLCSAFFEVPIENIEEIKKRNQNLYDIIENFIVIKENLQNKILTPRETDIMKLIAIGMTNKEMSEKLYISVGTIKWHINNIFGKLEVDNRVLAVKKAKKLKEIE